MLFWVVLCLLLRLSLLVGLILRLVVLLLSFGLVGLLGWCGWWLICLFVLVCGCFDAFA